MIGRRLAQVVMRFVAALVATMPAPRRDWGDAILAEFRAMSPEDQDLRWALGSAWFVLRHRDGRRASPARRASRMFSVLGVVGVAPWLLVSVQGLSDDAPDATLRSLLAMFVAQIVVALAFLVSWWRWRPTLLALPLSIVAYCLAAAFAAADNGGSPLLAAALFGAVPALAAVPVVLLGHVDQDR